MPVPDIFVLNNETHINAFAAGYTPADAAIVVTKGALTLLNRDELQGVIGHEFSHIINGDMHVNTMLIGWIYSITLFYADGMNAWRKGGDGSLSGLLELTIGAFGLLASRILKSGINREREYFADISSVRYARQNAGIIGALKKIACIEGGSTINKAKVEEVSHMMFCDSSLSELLSTHPPILKRIMLLDPGFNPTELETLRKKWKLNLPDGQKEDESLHTPETLGMALTAVNGAKIPTANLTLKVGTMSNEQNHQSRNILDNIPKQLMEAAHDYNDSIPLLLALLYSSDKDAMHRESEIVNQSYGDAICDQSKLFAEDIQILVRSIRIPLAQLCFPTICHHHRDDITKLHDTIHKMIGIDKLTNLFEYCLSHLFNVYLNDYQHPSSAGVQGRGMLKSAAPQIGKLLSVLAIAGNQAEDIQKAYQIGISHILPDMDIAFQPDVALATELDPVWHALDNLEVTQKKRLIEGIIMVIQSDNKVTIEEMELLRAICASLHCPLPTLSY